MYWLTALLSFDSEANTRICKSLDHDGVMESKQYVEDIDFQKYWLILRRRWLPGTVVFGLIVTLATTVAFIKKPSYSAYGKLLLQKRSTTSALVTEAGEKLGQLEALNNFINTPLDTEAQIITAQPILEKTIEKLNLKTAAGTPVEPGSILGGLKVEGIKGTDVMEVSFTSDNPEKAAAVVNQLMNVYVENNILTNRAEAVAAGEFIAKQLPQIQNRVRQAESALRNFKEQHNIVDLDEEGRAAVEIMTDLDKKISETKAQLRETSTTATELHNQLGLNSQQAIALNKLSQSRGIQQALTELEQVQEQLNVERTRFQDEAPVIISLKEKQAARQRLLKQRVEQVIGLKAPIPLNNLQISEFQQQMMVNLVNSEAERLSLANRVSALEQAKLAYKRRANILPELQEGLRDLERQLAASQVTYDLLLKNYQQIRIAENQNVGNARVITYASISQAPVSPKKKLIIVGGIIAGSLLYIVTAFVLDLMDSSIKTAKEIRQLFKYTWLGMIPESRKKSIFWRQKINEKVPQLVVRDAPHEITSEAYRMLEANLKFLSPDQVLKRIVVTSSVAQEGKSTVSANLAIAIAQVGRRVLLVDADMRHPMQHHIWDLANTVGLSEVIVHQTQFEFAVREVMDNLDVLPSGVIPPNSLALLNSQRMASLVEYFSQKYDFVIFDTPPLVLTADAITLGKMTDGILLVARPKIIDRVSGIASKEFLQRSGQQVLGLVINGVSVGGEPDSYFHHAQAYYKEELITSKKLQSKTPKNHIRF